MPCREHGLVGRSAGFVIISFPHFYCSVHSTDVTRDHLRPFSISTAIPTSRARTPLRSAYSWPSPPDEEAGNKVTETGFEGLTLYQHLARLLGQEFADILEEPKEEELELTGIVNNIVSR